MQVVTGYRFSEESRSNQAAIWGPICRESLTEIAMKPAVHWLATSGSLGALTLKESWQLTCYLTLFILVKQR